jgi:hypothetical protein
MLRAGRGRVATVIAAAAGLLAAGATGAMALTGSGGTPGQWSMAGQNIYDTQMIRRSSYLWRGRSPSMSRSSRRPA